ncbi:amidase [Auriculariales sp. MPI-PUGE-AT-0066]|nr:amidase [Auriculariales sp. MPI-PUGE-AT-0066]
MWPFELLFGEPRWITIARQKQIDCARAVDQGLALAGSGTSRDLEFLRASAGAIAEKIRNGEWTAGDVVRAYVRRAAKAHERFTILTEVRFAEAIREADALDAAAPQLRRGRLCGVPVSVKDQFDVKGLDTSIGFSLWVNKPVQDDAALVALMKEEGAIVLAKTNIPQTLLAFESTNPIFGRTSNPWNALHSCGGSSGGEGALLACDGSALGIGADIGGSLRIPSFWCGTYTLKPTASRISNGGVVSSKPGFEAIKVVAGAMGRTLSDVRLLTEIAFARLPRGSTFDPLPPVPFRSELATIQPGKKLRLGYYLTDGVIHASPPVQRAVRQTVDALQAAGHELVQLDAAEIDMIGAMEAFVGLTSSDGYRGMMQPARDGGEPIIDELFLTTLSPRFPGFVRHIAAWLVKTVVGDVQFGRNLLASRIKPVSEYLEFTAGRDKYSRQWTREVWNKHQLDGIIAPQMAVPAPEHGATQYVPQMSAATFLYNVLDYPVGILPVTRVDPVRDSLAANPLPPKVGHGNGTMVEHRLYGGSSPVYNAEKMAGLPVGIQVVGQRWEDEKVLGIMHVVEEALVVAGREKFGPGTWTEDANHWNNYNA